MVEKHVSNFNESVSNVKIPASDEEKVSSSEHAAKSDTSEKAKYVINLFFINYITHCHYIYCIRSACKFLCNPFSYEPNNIIIGVN